MKKLLLVFGVLSIVSANVFPQKSNNDSLMVSLESLLNIKISTVSKYEQKAFEAPASITIITSEMIEAYEFQSLNEILNTIPGFYQTYDRNYNYIGIRGFSRPSDFNNRILLLVDGHTVNENIFGAAPFGNDFAFNLNSIQRIEIIRGPGSVIYGTGAMLAVVNIITKKGSLVDGVKVETTAGSFGKKQASLLCGTETKNGIDFSLSCISGISDGEDLFFQEFLTDSTDGYARNCDWEKYFGINPQIRYKNFRFSANYMSRLKGIPTAIYDIKFNDDRAETQDIYNFYELSYKNNFNDQLGFQARVYYDNNISKGAYPYEIVNYSKACSHWFGSEIGINYDIASNFRLSAGSEFQNTYKSNYKSWDSTEVYFDAKSDFYRFSLYLLGDYQVNENLKINAGLRNDNYSGNQNSITPRISLVYLPNRSTTFKALYGEAFRVPNMFESCYEDPFSGFIRSKNLKPEKIKTFEFVWMQNLSKKVNTSASVFRYDMENLIDEYYNESDSTTQLKNTGTATAIGSELEINGKFDCSLNWYANYSFQKATESNKSKVLSNSPNHILKLGFNYSVNDFLIISAEQQYEPERITVRDSMNTNSFIVTNLNVSALAMKKHLKASLIVRNLFDVDYSHPAGRFHRMETIQQDGRNFLINLELSF